MTDEATLLDSTDRPTIQLVRRLPAPVERVWRAVTDEEEMRSWFPSAVQGERKVGAPLRFPFDQHVAEAFEGQVTEWEPGRVFAFTWNGDDVRIELVPDGDGTKLVFTHALSHMTTAARNASGWTVCLGNLVAYLGGPSLGDEWTDSYSTYLERMGPPLATVTPQASLTWERITHVRPERVWECLTQPDDLEGWMGYPVTIDARLGGSIHFAFDRTGDAVDGVIVAFEPPSRIAYTFDDLTIVEWRVEATPNGSRFWLSHHGKPATAATGGMAAGWHAFLLQLDMYMITGQLVDGTDEMHRLAPTYEALVANAR